MSQLVSGAFSTVLGAQQAKEGRAMQRDAQNELNDYERQALTNAYESVGINTAGSDLIRENGQQGAATFTDALQQGGSRAIIGGIPKVGAYLTETGQQAARNLDGQYINRDYAIAGDNANLRGIREGRDNQNIAALSSRINAGRNDYYNGAMAVGSGLSTISSTNQRVGGQLLGMDLGGGGAQQPQAAPQPSGPAYMPGGADSPWFNFMNSYPKV